MKTKNQHLIVNVFVHRLLGSEQSASLTPEQRLFTRDEDGGLSLEEVIKKYKPTMLLGMTGVGGLFKQSMIKEMAANCENPVIFPLSNPTIKAECTAEQAFEWTNGKCIFASGSPFDPVVDKSGQTFYPTQCNNSECGLLGDMKLDEFSVLSIMKYQSILTLFRFFFVQL